MRMCKTSYGANSSQGRFVCHLKQAIHGVLLHTHAHTGNHGQQTHFCTLGVECRCQALLQQLLCEAAMVQTSLRHARRIHKRHLGGAAQMNR